jgi:hypothetical protein
MIFEAVQPFLVPTSFRSFLRKRMVCVCSSPAAVREAENEYSVSRVSVRCKMYSIK